MQKTALRTEADNRVKEVQLELEAARTVSASLGPEGNYLLLILGRVSVWRCKDFPFQLF